MDSRTILRRDILATVALFVGLGLAWLAINAAVTPAPTTAPSPADVTTLNACTSDGPSLSEAPCYWNATSRGNGLGDSFILNEDGSITYP